MTTHNRMRRALSLSKPPFSFRGQYKTLSTASSHTLTDCDIGIPHPKRVVVVSSFGRAVTTTGVTIGGVAATAAINYTAVASCFASIWYASVPTGAIGDITVTHVISNVGAQISVWAGYPDSPTPVDALGNGSGGSNFTLTDLAKTAGGFAVFHQVANTTGAVNNLTGTGPETIVKDWEGNAFVDTLTYAFISSYSFVVTATSTTEDYTFTSTTSNNESGIGATWA